MAKGHTGDVAQATLNGCIACHGDRHSETFEKWKAGLELVESDALDAYSSARRAFDSAKELPDETRRKVAELLEGARADLEMIKRGNGLHNVTYSMEVLDSVSTRAQQASTLLSEAAPKP
jgi:hypothetical protein